jgi:hypothetical protein
MGMIVVTGGYYLLMMWTNKPGAARTTAHENRYRYRSAALARLRRLFPAAPQTVRHFDLAFLTQREAQSLNGTRIVCRVDLDAQPDERGDCIVFDCASPDDIDRTVWLRDGEQAEATMTVEATLHLR